MKDRRSCAVILICVLVMSFASYGETVVEWDFTKGVHGWTANPRVEPLKSTDEGLLVVSTGPDPWIEGPAVDYPSDKVIRITVRMKSTADGGADIFYGQSFKGGDETHFNVKNDGEWYEYPVIVKKPFGPRTRLRLDPCFDAGRIVVSSIKVEALERIHPPALDKPHRPVKGIISRSKLTSGTLSFEHYGKRWGNYSIKVDETEMAAGYGGEVIGFDNEGKVEWLNLKKAKIALQGKRSGGGAVFSTAFEDSRGAVWMLERSFRALDSQQGFIVETTIEVDKDTDVVRLPWLTLFSGMGTFGASKNQGVFAGLEYLSDEPSSSDADIAKPNHIRSTPDSVKITFPFMAISNGGKYIGLIWERSDFVAATFDSPDRIYNSGGHVMGLSSPAVGPLRFENDYCAHTPFALKANQPYKTTATIIGGKGKTIIPAVKHYIDLRGFPDLPKFKPGFAGAVDVLAHGWLDSDIYEDGRFKHAVWGDHFKAGPAADSAVYMDWLARQTDDADLKKRLQAEKDKALSKLQPQKHFSSGVSHVRPPNTPLIFGRVHEYVQMRTRQAKVRLGHFNEKGILPYRIGKQDYSRTHFAKHANGYSAKIVAGILEASLISGDKELVRKGVKLLDKQTTLYAGTVPRGAQTWEMPLHTPDILASAYMIKAYVNGYLLTDRQDFLEEAKYWAWTGVPFLYLDNPTEGEVGLYATIAVLGATNWQAPVWFGKPVQWCGLVYCSALHDLSDHDTQGPWEKIAKGITATGLQMTWSTTDKERQGLLPDYFFPVDQTSGGPAINPGTVGAHVPELYNKGTMYDLKKLNKHGCFIHAPCAIGEITESAKQATFTVDGWGEKPFYVLISGIKGKPQIKANPGQTDLQFYNDNTYAVIKLKGETRITISF